MNTQRNLNEAKEIYRHTFQDLTQIRKLADDDQIQEAELVLLYNPQPDEALFHSFIHCRRVKDNGQPYGGYMIPVGPDNYAFPTHRTESINFFYDHLEGLAHDMEIDENYGLCSLIFSGKIRPDIVDQVESSPQYQLSWLAY